MKLKDGYTSQNSFLDANQYVNALENDVEFLREKEKSKNERNFIDDVIVSLMEMNDRLIALEEMAAEHVAEHESAIDNFCKVPEWDLPENAKAIQEKIIDAFEDGFAAGEKRAMTVAEYKALNAEPAPKVEPEVDKITQLHESIQKAVSILSEFKAIGYSTKREGFNITISKEIA
ncbi:hypothetical protein PRA02_004690 [Salmonella enterica]|nr:hypothetical protein [Salmonella enterica]